MFCKSVAIWSSRLRGASASRINALRRAASAAFMITYRFGGFLLEPAERRLLRNDAVVSLPPRAFDVLVFLVERAGSLVTKDELLAAIWRDTAVEEANLCVAISAIRRAIGYDAVATVPKYGYRFVARLQVGRKPRLAGRRPRPSVRR
jgi:DNA-binding winged helix-turn-helix (wHTH) protein